MEYEIVDKVKVPKPTVEGRELFNLLKDLPMDKAIRIDFWRYAECCETRYQCYGVSHALRLSGENFSLRTRIEMGDLPSKELAEWESDPSKGLRPRGHHLWIWKEKQE